MTLEPSTGTASASSTDTPEAGHAWYVYGIQRAEDPPPGVGAGVLGIAVEGVETAGLRAIASKVTASELGERALREKVEDPEWLAVSAQAHESVLTSALTEGPVLPVRFGTVFRDRQALEHVLAVHSEEFHDEAERIAGCTEWAAKLLVDLAMCDRWLVEHNPSLATTAAAGENDSSAGRSYLVHRQRERATREARRVLLRDLAIDCHNRLSAIAFDARSERLQDSKLSGLSGQMILNGAYLLDEPSIAPFHAAATAYGENHADKGVRVELSGPWPAHHFISLPPIDADREEAE